MDQMHFFARASNLRTRFTIFPKISVISPHFPNTHSRVGSISPFLRYSSSTEEDLKRSVLSAGQQDIRQRIRDVLSELRQELVVLGLTTREDEQHLITAIESVDRMFLLVVVGEFNSGKSEFINALLGGDYCKVGPVPTTESIHIMRYGEVAKEEHTESLNVRVQDVPVPWLRDINLVDTPGSLDCLYCLLTYLEIFFVYPTRNKCDRGRPPTTY